MDENSLYIHDAYMARGERTEKRLWIALLVMIVIATVSNAFWFYYESQFVDEVTTTVTQELSAESGNAIVNDGVHVNGESENNCNYD